MNITINNLKFTNYNSVRNLKEKQEKPISTNTSERIFYAYPLFRGKTIPKLYEEYNWYINKDQVPAIKSFLKIQETPEIMDKFLTEILKTKDRSIEFFDSIIHLPREFRALHRELVEKIGPNSLNTQTFVPSSPYHQSYKNYLEHKFNNERSLVALLKIRPDWRGDKLIEKYRSLHGDDNLQIGNVPKEFPNGHLKQIVDYLRNEMEYGVKNKKKIKDLNICNRTYQFAYFTEGKSDKNVFGVFTPEGKKYVFKMGFPEKRSLDNPFALGTLAKIDTFLTTHRSRNSAPMCYYNHQENFSIYKYIEHISVGEKPTNMDIISSHLTDFKSLGLTYNDTVGDKNFFMLKPNSTEGIGQTEGFIDGVNNKEWISVDNDHVTFTNSFQPVIYEYCNFLPNAMQMFF